MLRQNKFKQTGFTLTELLVVIAIIIALAAASIPAVARFTKGRKVASAGRLIQGMFIKARSLAVAQRETHYLVIFNNSGGSVNVPRAGGGNSAANGSPNQIWLVDSEEKSATANPDPVIVQKTTLPEFTRIPPTGMGGATGRLYGNILITFRSDGTVYMNTNDRQDFDLTIIETTDVYNAASVQRRCYLNFFPNTGVARMDIRETAPIP